jgi:hypothetical protein
MEIEQLIEYLEACQYIIPQHADNGKIYYTVIYYYKNIFIKINKIIFHDIQEMFIQNEELSLFGTGYYNHINIPIIDIDNISIM